VFGLPTSLGIPNPLGGGHLLGVPRVTWIQTGAGQDGAASTKPRGEHSGVHPCRLIRACSRQAEGAQGSLRAAPSATALRNVGLCGRGLEPEADAQVVRRHHGMPMNGGELEPTQVLLHLARRYRECSSYEDVGRVTTTYSGPGVSFTRVKRFTTAFVRPDRFRFEFQDVEGPGPQLHYVIWTESGRTHLWSEPPRRQEEEEESLGLAIAAATGVSAGTAHTVSALLLPEVIDGWRLSELADPEFDQSATPVPGGLCIIGEGWAGRVRAYIDSASFALRRLETLNTTASNSAITVTDYEPLFDAPVAPNALNSGIAQADA
jgi:hypothetical protein